MPAEKNAERGEHTGHPYPPEAVEQVEFAHDDVERDQQGKEGDHGGGEYEIEEVVAAGELQAGEDEAAHRCCDEDADDGAGGDHDAVDVGDGQVGAGGIHHHEIGFQGPLLGQEGDGQAQDVGAGLEGGEEEPDEGVEHGEAEERQDEEDDCLGPLARNYPALEGG